jgi:hypothetical protein
MGKIALTPFLLLFIGSAFAAYDVNEVTLGASEKQIKARFPDAHCRPLEWPTRAAERRCDDSRVKLGGIDASITFYLKRDAVEGFDVRFDREQLERMMKFLLERYGKPLAEGPDPVKLEWKDKDAHAVLTAEPKRRRASLLVSRGTFDEEIYKVR